MQTGQRRIGLIVALLVLGLGVGWPIGSHYRAKARLARYKARLKAAGERLTVSELAPPSSVEGSSASMDLLQAAGFLRSTSPSSPSPDWSNFPAVMKYVGPGKALASWQQPILPSSETTNVWPGLRQEIDANADPLAALRAVLSNAPALAFDLDYNQGAGLLLGHLATLKSISQWLEVACVLDLHEGRTTNAFENLAALVVLGGKQGHEPLLIAELVRIAISAIGVSTTWEVLQSPDCSEDQLKALQTSWAEIDWLSQADSALAMERASLAKSYSQARASAAVAQSMFTGAGARSSLSDLAELGKEVLQHPQAGLRSFMKQYPAYWAWRWWQSYDDELADAESTQAALDAVRQAKREKVPGPAFKGFDEAAVRIHQAHPKAGTYFGYASTVNLQRFLLRVTRLEIQRSLTVTAIALKRYALRHGAYPADLAALVPEFLNTVPRDVMDGRPLRYRLNADGSFLLYSVGEDAVDNGGDPSPIPSGPKGWTGGRDVVWPAPATARETEEVLKSMGPK
jgi:hypothetical protein